MIEVLEYILEQWDMLHTPSHAAAYALEPRYHSHMSDYFGTTDVKQQRRGAVQQPFHDEKHDVSEDEEVEGADELHEVARGCTIKVTSIRI